MPSKKKPANKAVKKVSVPAKKTMPTANGNKQKMSRNAQLEDQENFSEEDFEEAEEIPQAGMRQPPQNPQPNQRRNER